MTLLLPMLLACQDPFAVDRHDLVGFRIAAIEAEPVESTTEPRAWDVRLAVVVDGRPFADEQPLLSWFWLEDPVELEAADALSEPDGVGPAPSLTAPEGQSVLGLLARYGDEEQRSFLVLDDTAAAPSAAGARPERVRARAVDLPVDTLDPETSAVEARRNLPVGSDSTSVVSGEALRLDAPGVPNTERVRWMATAGTFLELDGATTDWFASDLTLDEGEVEERADLPEQVVTFLALSTGSHRSRFAATDRIVSAEEPPDHTQVHGRLLYGADLDRPAYATLVADDLAPSGLALVDPTPIDPVPRDLQELELFDPGTTALPCFEPVFGPFDPNWLLELLCPRAPLDGARVLVVPDVWRDAITEAP